MSSRTNGCSSPTSQCSLCVLGLGLTDRRSGRFPENLGQRAVLEREVLDASEIKLLVDGKELPPMPPPPSKSDDGIQHVIKPDLTPGRVHGFEPTSLRYFRLQPDGSLSYVTQEQIDAARHKPQALHHEWNRIVQRCLDPDPVRRFRDAGEVAAELEPARSRRWCSMPHTRCSCRAGRAPRRVGCAR